jgi:hypothetical protein
VPTLTPYSSAILRTRRRSSRRLENLVQVPFQELPLRPVGLAFGQVDDVPGSGVELIAVTELVPQPGADKQAVPGIDAEM